MIKMGFTGARRGITDKQLETFVKFTGDARTSVSEFHHGDCIGADATCARIMHALGVHIVSHPPVKDEYRAYAWADEEREPEGYIQRNQNIVDEVDLLVAIPDGPEQLRSGTWATIRYAKRLKKEYIIIWPSGTITWENARPREVKE